jgi:hypothetical protein
MVDKPEAAVARGSGHGSAGSHDGQDDVDAQGIFAFCLGLLVTAILIQGMIWLLFQYFSARESTRLVPDYPLAAGQEMRVPPEPRLQTDPRADLRELRVHEDEVLSTYGWVDKGAGVVRIPIEDALKITAQRGLPARAVSGDAQK